jgi:rare lipoprotein A
VRVLLTIQIFKKKKKADLQGFFTFRFLLQSQLLFLFSFLLLLTFSSPVRSSAAELSNHQFKEQIQETPRDDQETSAMETMACYYAKRFQGKRTASGQRYHPNMMTAAHPTLPLGTQVMVTNPINNRSVTVTVNDRCRRRSRPFIDLSWEAARQLGILRQGQVRVKVFVMTEDNDSGSE